MTRRLEFRGCLCLAA